uniref:Protein kinase domain-containing protein n=1 Tax=Amphimedon queenslandica TaxID=400682 RepID=A0A1X7T474_AMPQE
MATFFKFQVAGVKLSWDIICLKLSKPGGSVQWPKERGAHSSVLINTSSGPHLLVMGGTTFDTCIFDIINRSWKKLFNMPNNVTDRQSKTKSNPILPNILIELCVIISYSYGYTSNSDWSTSIIPLDQYQEKLQERRREWEASQLVQPEDRREIDRLTLVLQERESELQEERREKEQVRNRLQQQLQQAQQQGQERERQAREQEHNLQRQLQEREREIQEGGEREQGLQRQFQQAQQQLQESQERERGLEQQLRERDRQERESSWVVSRNDIRMTERILGRGGWGEVRVARFHGLEVAAKVLHETIISEYNVSLFSREMNIASKIRHPNLLQFIGATTEGLINITFVLIIVFKVLRALLSAPQFF